MCGLMSGSRRGLPTGSGMNIAVATGIIGPSAWLRWEVLPCEWHVSRVSHVSYVSHVSRVSHCDTTWHVHVHVSHA